MPNMAPDGPLDKEQKGPLSIIGDPLGSGLKTTLKPTLGAITGSIGRPTGEAAVRLERVAKYENAYSHEDNGKPDKELPGGERIGGKPQNGQNPLGL